MRDNIQALIRATLRERPEGLIVRDIASTLDKPRQAIQRGLSLMPDAYIDRWQPAGGPFGYAAVWCVVEVPANCPKPRS